MGSRFTDRRKWGHALVCTLSFILAGMLTAANCRADAASAPTDPGVQALFDQGWDRLSRMDKDFDGLYEAVELYDQVLKIDPDNRDVYWKLAEVKFKIADGLTGEDEKEKMWQACVADAETSIARHPEAAGGYYWLGCATVRLAELASIFKAPGMVKGGIENLKKTIAVEPASRFAVLARAVLAAVYAQAPWPIGDIDQAEAYAREAVQMDPHLTLARRWLAEIYAEQGDVDQARTEIEACLAVETPTYPWDSRLNDWPAVRKLKGELEK